MDDLERCRRLIEETKAGYFRIDREGRFQQVNRAWLQMHGYSSPDEIIGKHFSVTQVEAGLGKAQEYVKRLLSGEAIPSGEFSRRCKYGSICYHTFSANPIINSVGEVVGLEGFLIDITESKKAEESLLFSEQRFRNLVETTSDWVWEVDKNAVYTYVSPKIKELLGYEPEEILGKTPFDFMPSEEAKRVADIFGPMAAAQQPLANIENTNLHKDGHPVIFETSGVPFFDISGDFRGYRGIDRDITERKQAEEALRNSEEFINNILETVDEGFVVIDKDYRIISANKAYCEQVKSPHCDIFGRHCYEISHHLDRPCFLEGEECAPSRTFKTGMPYATIHTHYDREGYPVYIEAKSYPVKDASGTVTAAIETLNNITDRRRLEEQLRHAQKMEAIGTLAGGIAHDFNNMLNIIIGYGALMQMKMKPDDPQMEQLKEILAAGDKAAQLAKGLLIFSRKQTLDLIPVNINELIDGFKKMLGRIIGEDIELRISISDEAFTVMADRGHLEQILMNLAVNARDAMHKGGMLSIETTTMRIDSGFTKAHGYGEPGKYVLISVTDTGTGMDETTRERIFEPYFTTKGIGSGTGLGLSIVFGIVKQHKGYIHCYSELGKGTTFKIYMPFAKVEGIEREELEAATPTGGTETVLVAEDDQEVRHLTKTALESFGYTVIEAVDGEDAVKKFKENKDRIQLVILDVIMPRKNGRDAYEDIKGISHDIRAVFMSGYSSDIIQSKGLLEDDMGFISKPVSPNELLRKVREVLDKAN